MKRLPSGGYTIIEVMIVLVISTALLGSTLLMVNQRNQRTAFAQAAEDVRQRMQDTLNDIATGYYPTTNRLNCVTNDDTGPPVVTQLAPAAPDKPQGSNANCIFMGKAVEFNKPTAGSAGTVNAYTIVGRKTINQDALKREVSSIADAKPVVASSSFDSFSLYGTIEVTKVLADTGNPNSKGFSIVSAFGTTSDSGMVQSYGNRPTLAYVASSPTASTTQFITDVQGTMDPSKAQRGILICIQEIGGGSKAAVRIGANGQAFTAERLMDGNVPSEC